MKNRCNPSGCRHFAHGDERTRERITLPTAHNFYLSRENRVQKKFTSNRVEDISKSAQLLSVR